MGEHNFLDSLYSQNVSFSNYTFKGLEKKKTSTTLENQETVRRKVATSPQTKQGFTSKKKESI